MKFKTLLVPLVGLTVTTGFLPLMISCGEEFVIDYDKPIDLNGLVRNRKKFKRLTKRYTEQESITDDEAINEYIRAVQENNYVFDDDMFEGIAASDLWDERGNTVNGKLKFENIYVESGDDNAGLLSVTAKLDHANLSLNEPVLFAETELGFNGQITFTKVPFDIYYEEIPENSKWWIEVKTARLAFIDTWSISINGTGKIDDYEEDIEDVWDKEAIETPILGYLITELLGLLRFHLLYYKDIGKTAQ